MPCAQLFPLLHIDDLIAYSPTHLIRAVAHHQQRLLRDELSSHLYGVLDQRFAGQRVQGLWHL